MPLISELYAFVVTETPGNEGVPTVQLGDMMFPLLGADVARVESLRAMAQQSANATGMSITLARFSVREDLEHITPQGRGAADGR